MQLSVIIVNYNVKNLLRDCLLSVQKAAHSINTEIIVVDNASSDGSVEMLKEEFKDFFEFLNDMVDPLINKLPEKAEE